MTIAITDNPAQHRYEATRDGTLAGFAEYNLMTDAILFSQTEVLRADVQRAFKI